MTAVLSLVPALPAEGTVVVPFGPAEARSFTDALRRDLVSLRDRITEARERAAHTALGYEHWHEYVAAEFGRLDELRLPRPERQALVGSMHDAGLPSRTIREQLAVSAGTVDTDLRAVGAVRRSSTVGRDGVERRTGRRPAAVVEEAPAPVLSKPARVAVYAGSRGALGVTTPELMAEFGWKQSSASAALSTAKRQGLVRPTVEHRDGYGVHVRVEA